MDDTAISVKHVSKSFKLPHEKNTSLKKAVINFGSNKGYEMQHVLKGISFDIKKGEFFGIVGRNGSGKSTLLKLLAGIYTPNAGHIQTNGTLTPFIELGVGFNPELTGRENVFLNGALLGFSHKEMESKYDDIVEFAELGRFMDQKLKNYSSGMKVRLAFSIAIRAKSDILLVDEVLAVGDANFQRKCYEYFYELKRNKNTVVLVTHDMAAVNNFCDRAALINNGEIVEIGSAAKVAQSYSRLNVKDESKYAIEDMRWGSGEIDIISTTMGLDSAKNIAKPGDKIEIELDMKCNQDIEDPIIGVTIKDLAGREIFVTNTKALNYKTGRYNKNQEFKASFSINNVFNDGSYTVTPAIADKDMTKVVCGVENACGFEVIGWPFPTGIVQAPVKYKSITIK